MEVFVIIITALVGGFSTFYSSEKLNMGPLKASALLSVIVAGIFQFLIDPKSEMQIIPIVFFGASFVGMASKKLFSELTILIPSLLFGGIFILLEGSMDNLGGKLGTSACIACLLSYGAISLKKKTGPNDKNLNQNQE